MWKILALAVLLAGCTAPQGPTAAQKEARDIGLAVDKARKETAACSDAIERLPEYQKLSDRLTIGKPSMELLADARKPTAADVPLLLVVHRQLAACRTQNVQLLALAHPAFVSGAGATYAEADIDYAKLVRREISWGDYAQLGLGRASRFEMRYQEAAQKIIGGLRKSHDREALERQAASQALADWARAQRSAFPVTTSCVYTGPILSCQSY